MRKEYAEALHHHRRIAQSGTADTEDLSTAVIDLIDVVDKLCAIIDKANLK